MQKTFTNQSTEVCTVGRCYSLKCTKCRYTLEYNQGAGALHFMETMTLLEKIQRGKLGKQFKDAANNAAAPWVEFSRELYRCDNCGKLRSDMKIELLDGGEVILSKSHPCRKCRTPMSIVDGPDGLKCPKCKSNLIVADMLLWD